MHLDIKIITLERIVTQYHITVEVSGFKKLVNRINILTPQGPPNFFSEYNKSRFSISAFLAHPWAVLSDSTITTLNLSYNVLVTALREQLQLESENNKTRGTHIT